MTQHTQPKGNDLAVASLILGILGITSFGILTGIPALITGFMGLKNPVNKGMSIAGIVMGGLSILGTILLTILLIVLFSIGIFAAAGEDQENYDVGSPDSSSQQRI